MSDLYPSCRLLTISDILLTLPGAQLASHATTRKAESNVWKTSSSVVIAKGYGWTAGVRFPACCLID
jgi:hypothetical protein